VKNEEGTGYTTEFNLLLTAHFYKNTWFSTEYLSHIMKTSRGSLAGAPLADVVYGLAMSRVLFALEVAMNDAGINANIKLGNGDVIKFTHSSYHDDVMIPISGPAERIVDYTCKNASIVYTVFKMYGLTINFSKNKTEAIASFHGKKAVSAKGKLARNNMNANFEAGNNQFNLRFVTNYKHVGTKTSITCNMAEEVVSRSGMMKTDCRTNFRKVFKINGLQIHKKLYYARCYIMSKGTYQCSTWPQLNQQVFQKFHSAVMYVYRAATNKFSGSYQNKETPMSDDDLIFNFQLVSPTMVLRNARIQLFIRIIRKMPNTLLS